MSRYENGSSLTRGEFVAHMERVDQTLEGIVERLERIEDRVNRPKILFLSGLTTVSGKVFFVIISLILAYVTTHFGLGLDPFSQIGF